MASANITTAPLLFSLQMASRCILGMEKPSLQMKIGSSIQVTYHERHTRARQPDLGDATAPRRHIAKGDTRPCLFDISIYPDAASLSETQTQVRDNHSTLGNSPDMTGSA